MLVGKNLLIVEKEFLIALDIQRILETAKVGATLFARSVEEAEKHGERLTVLDLAIIDLSGDYRPALALAMRLAESGIAVVFMRTEGVEARSFSGLPEAQLITKPFAENELLSACLAALLAKGGNSQ